MHKFLSATKKPSYRLAHCGNFPNYKLDADFLSNVTIIYLVSVGKDKFKAKWVERFVNFLNETKPAKALIVVADSLQRFNIEIDLDCSEIEAYDLAITRGNQWIEDNKSYFSKSTVKYEFICWEELRKDEYYTIYLSDIIKLRDTNKAYEKALLESTEEYMRRPTRSEKDNKILAMQKSNSFLEEECAVFKVLAKDEKNKVIFYPGKITAVLEYIINYINQKYRCEDNPLRWKELRPTKEKANRIYNNDVNLSQNYLKELPFFKVKKLSFVENDTNTACALSIVQ